MNTSTIKPIPVKNNYISPEDAIKLIETIPVTFSKSSSRKKSKIDLEKRVEFSLEPKDSGSQRRQEDWIREYNNQGIIFPSIADYYLCFKQIYDDKKEVVSHPLHKSLLNDLHKNVIITSTTICYDLSKTKYEIIHHYESEIIKPEVKKVEIPIYENYPLDKLLETKTGLEFVQALFDTEDSAYTIKEILSYTTLKSFDQILFNTLDLNFSPGVSKRSVNIGNEKLNLIHIYANIPPRNENGRSRNMKYVSQGATK